MIAEVRQKELLEILKKKKCVNINETASKFGVSTMTIRRDLEKLYSENLLTKVHGGAVKNDFLVTSVDVEYNKRKTENLDRKKKIANEAVKLLTEDCTIYLDGGTTCGEVAAAIPKSLHLTVITDNLSIHETLQRNENIEVILIGGVTAKDHNTLDGFLASEMAKLLSCDIAFFSCASADLSCIMNSDTIGLGVKNEMIKKANYKVCLCDSTKLGHKSIYQVVKWDSIDCFITDSDASESFIKTLRTKNKRIKCTKC